MDSQKVVLLRDVWGCKKGHVAVLTRLERPKLGYTHKLTLKPGSIRCLVLTGAEDAFFKAVTQEGA